LTWPAGGKNPRAATAELYPFIFSLP